MPLSERKLAANRANALKSTGPRTAEGKQRSSRNALRHKGAAIGIAAPLRGEYPNELHAIRAAMIEQYDPQNIQEMEHLECIVSAYVRLQRAEEISAALLDGFMAAAQLRRGKPAEVSDNEPLGCATTLTDVHVNRAWRNIELYRQNATLEYHRAVQALVRTQNARLDEPVKAMRRQADYDAYLKRTHCGYARQFPAGEVPGPENEARNEPTSPAPSTTVASNLQTPAPRRTSKIATIDRNTQPSVVHQPGRPVPQNE